MSAYEDIRARHLAELVDAMPDYVDRLGWNRTQIETHRRRTLRLLLRVAAEYSPWHRERLRDVDLATATEADLERVPPMTRTDLMEHWDEIVIYPSFSLAAARDHLEGLTSDAYLGDSFHVVASAGSEGAPGVFLYDWDGWLATYAGCARWRLLNRPHILGGRKPTIALVTSDDPAHVSRAVNQSFCRGTSLCLPASLPLHEIVRGLNEGQPDVLNGYPSVMWALLREACAGRLRIRPSYVNCTGEPFAPGLAEEIRRMWQARTSNGWSASEALPLAQSCSTAGGLHLNEDLVITEPVDALGRRVPAGMCSDKVYLTNLFNLALPLIRYELSDQMCVSTEPCACGSEYALLEEVRGHRDRFVYPDGVTVDPVAIDSVLRSEKSVVDYRVVQTDRGAEVQVCCESGLHLRAVGQRVASALGKGGVERPAVSVKRVDRIERGPAGKLRRFVPRPQSQGGAS